MPDTATVSLDGARDAMARHGWAEAFDAFAALDAREPLGPDDLDRMAECAWWLGKMRHAIALRERAHQAYLKEGNHRRAAMVASDLADHHGDLHETSVSSVWIQRAQKLLTDQDEGPEHGWLALTMALHGRMQGEVTESSDHAVRAADIATRFGDKDLLALALAIRGSGMVFQNEIDEGMALVEEATMGAVSGELGPKATGWIYCLMITVASQIADWQKAGQWTEAAKRWCDRQAINGFPGVCRVHRAEIMRLRGALTEAEDEARTATVELASFNLHHTAIAFRELGEVRLRMGDIDAAEEAFRQANEMGVTPQPGLALLQMERGNAKGAASSLRRALADAGLPALDRAKLLPAQADIALELDDVATAKAAAEELATIAAAYTSPALEAVASATASAVALAEGNLATAEQGAKRARQLYKETDLIYEAARVCVLLGRVYAALGDDDEARFEVSSALAAFQRIGAIPDAGRARVVLEGIGQAEISDLRLTKTFLFSDIVRSTALIDAIGDDAWSDLLSWHDETLRTLFAEHGGEEVVHTGDGFFIAFEGAGDAVSCAIAIQRRLVDHRREHGFAPQVRIGLHATEATQTKGNYHGMGVHEAARIGALAQGGEIVASSSTLDGLSGVTTTDERSVELKGVPEPVPVVSVGWDA